jgi:hypothetical protein
MKKKTWWGKGENRQAGSIELDDDTQDEPGWLLQPPAFANQYFSAFFADERSFCRHQRSQKGKTCFQVNDDAKNAAPYNKGLRTASGGKASCSVSSPTHSIHS